MAQLPGPAAAWEDELDLDDSDIRFVPPPLPRSSDATASRSQPQQDKPPQPSHHHHHRIPIPGPAAAKQDTVLPRAAATRAPLSLGRGDARATDADFLLPPWLCVLHFLGKDRARERLGIRDIKDDEELDRAPLVAGVVTSCKPNGHGDLFLVLKDPTGSISASVHKKVLLEENNSHDITIGCALVFGKVAIFHPSHKLCYLNVTKGKVIKVFSKDCAAPAKQVISSSTTERNHGGDSTSNIMMKILGREDMMPSNNKMTVTEVSREQHATSDSSNSTSIKDRFSLGSNQEGKLLVGGPHNRHTSSCSTDGHLQQSIPNTIDSFWAPTENVNTSSRSPLKRKRAESEWTEEQLSELMFVD